MPFLEKCLLDLSTILNKMPFSNFDQTSFGLTWVPNIKIGYERGTGCTSTTFET
jgi:hypothetical protein